MPRACHKNVSSQKSYGFVLKNDKHMMIWHLNMAIWDCLVISCLLLWIHNYNSWHKCITIYTVNSNSSMGQISHNVPITSELRSFLCDPHYRPPLITTIYSWTWRLIQIQSHCHCLNALSKVTYRLLHVLVSFDIWFKCVPHQWIHLSLEQNRSC